MTVIAGIAQPGKGVLLAADSLSVGGWDAIVRKDPKLFQINAHLAIGFTTSYRMGQILRYHLDEQHVLTDTLTAYVDLYEWTAMVFVPRAREVLAAHGYTKVESQREEGGTFLLGVGDRLLRIESDFAVTDSTEGILATGCGADYAIGAMYALPGATAHKRLTTAIEAATRYSAGCGGPRINAQTKAFQHS